MKCLAVKLAQIIFCISFCNCLPAYDFDALNEIDGNQIDGGHTIDLSGLGPEAYGLPKSESGDLLATWNETSLMNPEEMGEYAEGDILIPLVARNGVRDESQQWPNGHVPYVIEGHFNQDQRDLIMKAIADYHRLTCLRFVPYKGQQDYLVIQSKNTGCWSSVGRMDDPDEQMSSRGSPGGTGWILVDEPVSFGAGQLEANFVSLLRCDFEIEHYTGVKLRKKIGGRQEVNLQIPGCISKKGTVLHELLHAVGFMHEQSRPERDDFVTVRYNNIKPGAENNFRKADTKSSNGYGVPYDYNSVMHYSEYAFSKNSQKTIEPKVGGVKLGQREGLSRGDVRKINNMYNCKKEEPQSGWSLTGVFQNLFGGKAAEIA